MTRLRKRLPRPFLMIAALALVLGGAAAMQLLDANPAVSQNQELIAREANSDPGLDPASSVWDGVAGIQLPVSAQPGAYAAGGGSIAAVTVQALHYKEQMFFRVEWDDSTEDAVTTRVQDFSDAVAVEIPARSATSVPSICMGQADQGVNIWQWRADSAEAEHDPDKLYANAAVDFYPSRDNLWYPARAVGNPYAIPGAGPAQDLVAHAFGTIGPASSQDVKASGSYGDGKWAVVFSRGFDGATADQASFSAGDDTDIAFAVWNGSEGDRNGMKSVSQFATLSISGALAGAGGGGRDSVWPWIAAGILVLSIAIASGLVVIGSRT